jgi:hypothetical protein
VLRAEEGQAQIDAVPLRRIDVGNGIVTRGVGRHTGQADEVGSPGRPDRRAILEIGAYDGYFSFERERRAADVLAVDVQRAAGFDVAHRLLGSQVGHKEVSIYDVSPSSLRPRSATAGSSRPTAILATSASRRRTSPISH